MEHISHDYERGRSDGAADVASGSPKFFWQTRGRWGAFLTKRMAELFGVCVEHTSDITWAAQKSYRAGYNDVVKTHIEKQYGAGSFQTLLTEVEQFRKMDYHQQFGSS